MESLDTIIHHVFCKLYGTYCAKICADRNNVNALKHYEKCLESTDRISIEKAKIEHEESSSICFNMASRLITPFVYPTIDGLCLKDCIGPQKLCMDCFKMKKSLTVPSICGKSKCLHGFVPSDHPIEIQQHSLNHLCSSLFAFLQYNPFDYKLNLQVIANILTKIKVFNKAFNKKLTFDQMYLCRCAYLMIIQSQAYEYIRICYMIDDKEGYNYAKYNVLKKYYNNSSDLFGKTLKLHPIYVQTKNILDEDDWDEENTIIKNLSPLDSKIVKIDIPNAFKSKDAADIQIFLIKKCETFERRKHLLSVIRF